MTERELSKRERELRKEKTVFEIASTKQHVGQRHSIFLKFYWRLLLDTFSLFWFKEFTDRCPCGTLFKSKKTLETHRKRSKNPLCGLQVGDLPQAVLHKINGKTPNSITPESGPVGLLPTLVSVCVCVCVSVCPLALCLSRSNRWRHGVAICKLTGRTMQSLGVSMADCRVSPCKAMAQGCHGIVTCCQVARYDLWKPLQWARQW